MSAPNHRSVNFYFTDESEPSLVFFSEGESALRPFLTYIISCFSRKCNAFLALLRLVAEGDLAGGAVHGIDDGEALQLDALAADQLAALLEALLDGDADALHGGTGLLGQLQQTHQSAAVGKEVVDDEDVVLRGEELLGDDDVVNFLVGEGLDLRLVVVVVEVDAHRLFGEHHRHVELAGHHSRDADAAGLDGEHLVDGLARKQALPLLGHLPEQRDVHLVVDEAVHLQHVAFADDAVFADAVFQHFHVLSLPP